MIYFSKTFIFYFNEILYDLRIIRKIIYRVSEVSDTAISDIYKYYLKNNLNLTTM